ncbi:nucleoporin Nup186/Nup192/Nup205 [Aspergillus unguis]
MESAEALAGLRALYQDLCALSDSSLVNIDRLRVELEAHIKDFRTLLDKPKKSNASRQQVLSGKIVIDDVEYSVNEDFQQGTLQLADALDIDELIAALLFFRAQEEAQELDRPPVIAAITKFHQRRNFLLESLRLIFQESFEVEREATQELMQDMLAHVTEIKDGQLRNASLYTRKCLNSMEEIETWLLLLNEQVQKVSLVGSSEDRDIMEAIEHQRGSLLQQHESLGAIVCYLFKGPYTSPEDLRILLNRLRKLDRFDAILVHYVPAIISSFVQHGSPERSGNYNEARSLNTAITTSKDGQHWAHQPFHSAVIALWLSVYSAWDYDGPSSAPPGVNLEKEAEERTKTFMSALDDGGLDLLVSICSGVSGEEWDDPVRSELVTMLLRESASWMKESGSSSLDMDSNSFLKDLLKESFESFVESCVANMPDAVRKLKTDEDSQRLDQITALRDGLTSNLHRSLVEARTHLESFLLIMAFAFEGRPDAAQEFWADPDGNLYGFLQWSSKRQTVPRVSAFCELLCSISGGEDNAAAAHRFLMEEDKFMGSKFKRSASMNWSQMFAELQIYATRVTEKPVAAVPTFQRARKYETSDMSEPESPVMLSCYLRLVGHLSRQSTVVREWMLQHSSFHIVSTLLTLCSGPLPSHLRATVFQALAGLMTDRSMVNGNEMWLSLDQWISSGSMSTSAHKVPLVSNPFVWHEQQAFEKIGESFDQANAFVVLILSLVSPAVDSAGYHVWIPFPESLGSSYRMPGIEPYIDFILGQTLTKKVPDLNERQSRLLTYNSLDFVLTCLKSFNEALVTALSGASSTTEPSLKTSTLLSYVRLHPFARVAEWLYNEDVIKALFATANQDIADVSKYPSDSILVLSLVKSIEVMSTIIDLQSTYFNIVRPFIKSQPGTRLSVANSSLSAFEDCVLTNLNIIPNLCLYCSTGHQQLTVSSLALLEKLSSSERLNKLSSPELSRWRSSNKIVEVLSTQVNMDSVSLPFVSQMMPESRELDSGPLATGYIIRQSLLHLLNSCLGMIGDQPTVAHLLLGFGSVGNILDVPPDGLFANGASLLHGIIAFLQGYPEEIDGNIVPWMLSSKRLAFEVLKHLWSSKLSSYYTLAEMRATGFLSSLLATQLLVGPDTPWDGVPIAAEHFWVCESTDALSEFLLCRSYLFDYAATEIRSASKMGSPTLLNNILSTLFGSSTSESGTAFPTPTVFDLFDFADLDITFGVQPPKVEFLGGVDIEACAKPLQDVPLVMYDVDQVAALVKTRREELMTNGELRPQDDELFLAEADNLTMFLRARNQSRLITFHRQLALRSWAELLTTILTCSELEGGRKSTFVLHAIQITLPKLEAAIEEDLPEGLDLARLAETLVENLDPTPIKSTIRRTEDIVDEKLRQLFQICVRGIVLATESIHLKETFYNICSLYVARIVSPGVGTESMRQHTQQIVRSSGPALIEAICDDAYTGQETCRISAVLLLNALAALDTQTDAILAESISQSNYLTLFLDSLRVLPLELGNAQSTDTPLLLSYYESLLSLLQQLCQTKSGATHILKAGLFQAVRDSQLFAADPDLGIDIDNPDALRKYYDLLDSVLRVIVTATFSRGVHNEQMIELTRSFLTENRQSMVGVFKRFAKIGGSGSANHHDALTSIAKSYTALVAATDFLEVEENEVQQHIGPKLFS